MPDPEDATKAVLAMLDAGADWIRIELFEKDKSGWQKSLTISARQWAAKEGGHEPARRSDTERWTSSPTI